MKRWTQIALAALLALPALASAAYPPVGSPAPDFSLTNEKGKTVHLKDYRGHLVVLEWTNPECPFVHKHYDSGNMQNLQRKYTADGVVWLTINSAAPGSDACIATPKDARVFKAERKADMTALLLDPHAKVARAYGAKNTPTLFVLDQAGRVAYEGAIDDRPTPDAADVKGARNYVAEALDELRAGRPVAVPHTRAYGCHIEYAD